MKINSNIIALAAFAGLVFASGAANAAITLLEDFEAATTTTNFANTMYDKGTAVGDSTALALNGIANVPSDSGNNLTKTAIQHSSNRLLILRDPLALHSGGYTSMTVGLDYYYNYSTTNGIRLEYSALGDFTDSQNVFTWASNAVTTRQWQYGASVVLNEGTYTFTDTAKIRFRSGGTANSTHGYLDNITITAIPEPSSTALLGLAGVALMLRRRR